MASYRFFKPTRGPATSGWASPRYLHGQVFAHQGVDVKVPVGTPVFAVQGGRVTLSEDGNPTAGNWIIVDHGDGFTSRYIHLSVRLVEVGDYVHGGQLIALSGETATEGMPHLHFDMQAVQALLMRLKMQGLTTSGRMAPGTNGYNIPAEQMIPGMRPRGSDWLRIGEPAGICVGGAVALAAGGYFGYRWWRRRYRISL